MPALSGKPYHTQEQGMLPITIFSFAGGGEHEAESGEGTDIYWVDTYGPPSLNAICVWSEQR
jgi:hypothetical protein